MKKFMKIFILIASLLVISSNAIAFCVPMNGNYVNPVSGFVENSPRIYDANRQCYVPAGTQTSGIVLQGNNDLLLLQQLLTSQQGRVPGLASCGWNIAGAIAGATVGSFNSAYTDQAKIIGGIAGWAIGNSICEDRRREAIAEARLIAKLQATIRAQQAAINQQGQQDGITTSVPAKCDFGGGVIAYTYEGQAGCNKIAAMASKQVGVVAQQLGGVAPVVGSCRIPRGGQNYRFNQVSGRRIGPAECDDYAKGRIPFPPDSELALVP